MEKSKPRRTSGSSSVRNACVSPAVVLEVCQCNTRFKELDSFLSALELEEHKRILLQYFQKFKTTSETRDKANAVHLQVHKQDLRTSPFELCPFLHYEGLWNMLSDAFIKLGHSSDDGGNLKSLGEAKQKVNVNPKSGVKKKVKAKSGFKLVPPKTSGFQHNVPVDVMLQVYRDNHIYSKARMRRVDKVAIMNASQSSMSCKQVPTPAIVVDPRFQVPREICTQVVNLSFSREFLPVNQRNIRSQGLKEPSYHKEKNSSVKSAMANERSTDFAMVIKQLFPNTAKNLPQ